MFEGLTPQQEKWFASVRANFEATSGRSLADWIAIARSCPETAPRARRLWFKEKHGPAQNHVALVEHERALADGVAGPSAAEQRATLWADPASAAILAAIEAAVAGLPDLITGQRKAFTSWSRRYAFAAARPVKGGAARLGLAVPPDADPRLVVPGKSEGWSERLTAAMPLDAAAAVDAGVAALLRAAWERS